ncbi:unnamed protein product [Caenorhabditis auriculariae]|uniref:Uncharacterized protein n=1 Tax=Caenorhabditis auriculariae TaxID=2777116 RepID=A0A8S1HE61_9PELO|nr:unnamed protein product [Caenorhabditis auriculariae]
MGSQAQFSQTHFEESSLTTPNKTNHVIQYCQTVCSPDFGYVSEESHECMIHNNMNDSFSKPVRIRRKKRNEIKPRKFRDHFDTPHSSLVLSRPAHFTEDHQLYFLIKTLRKIKSRPHFLKYFTGKLNLMDLQEILEYMLKPYPCEIHNNYFFTAFNLVRHFCRCTIVICSCNIILAMTTGSDMAPFLPFSTSKNGNSEGSEASVSYLVRFSLTPKIKSNIKVFVQVFNNRSPRSKPGLVVRFEQFIQGSESKCRILRPLIIHEISADETDSELEKVRPNYYGLDEILELSEIPVKSYPDEVDCEIKTM